MIPLPWMVLPVLVRVRLLPFSSMNALPPFERIVDSVRVPPPLSVVLPLRTRYPLPPLPPLSWIAPLLLMVGPLTVRVSLSSIDRVLPLARVRSSIPADIFKVTVDTPSTMSTLKAPFGTTSPDQLPATFQSPEDPSDQVSVVWPCAAGKRDSSATTRAHAAVPE